METKNRICSAEYESMPVREEKNKKRQQKGKSKKPASKVKIVYAEPYDYFPREIRKECKLGEYAEDKNKPTN